LIENAFGLSLRQSARIYRHYSGRLDGFGGAQPTGFDENALSDPQSA
jgi:hypothetical protein